MDPAVIVAVFALLVSFVGAYFAFFQAKAAVDSADSAKEQAKAANKSADLAEDQVAAANRQIALQEQIRQDEAQPYVVADIKASDESGHLLQVVLENHGRTSARDIKVSFDPPLPKRLGGDKGPFTALEQGVSFLAPKAILRWHLGTSFSYFEDGTAPPQVSVTVNAVGPFGPLEPLTYAINIAEFAGRDASDTGTLLKIQKSIDALTETVAARRQV